MCLGEEIFKSHSHCDSRNPKCLLLLREPVPIQVKCETRWHQTH